MTDYMKLIIATYRYAKELLRIASDGDTTSIDGKVVKSMSLQELEEINTFVKELESHGIREQIQKIAN